MSLSEYLAKFKSIVFQLRTRLGDQTSHRHFMLQLLRSLPSEFRPIRTVLESPNVIADSETGWTSVISRLIDFKHDLKKEKEPKPTSETLLERNRTSLLQKSLIKRKQQRIVI